MALTSFQELMRAAEGGSYAVGYFESWNFESLLAVADAAEAMRSPVILGFSGIYLPHQERVVADRLGTYAAMGLDVCRRLSVPACLLFNESPNLPWVHDAIDLGFDLVMYTDETLDITEQARRVRSIVERAAKSGTAVEGEMVALPGVGGHCSGVPDDLHLTDPREARRFVDETGVDALAVNIGQIHLHGKKHAPLDLTRLAAVREQVRVPLVLHGASSVTPDDLLGAIRHGIRKINVGSVLKQRYFRAVCDGCAQVKPSDNPYEVIGSGLRNDVLVQGRIAMRNTVEEFMTLFGSAGKA